MLHTTLRQLGIVSGRAILAIGLTMGAMTVWTSSAKADQVFINNPAVEVLAFTQDAAGQALTAIAVSNSTGLTSTPIGSINLKSNSVAGYTVKASSANNGTMDQGAVKIAYKMQYPAATAFNAAILTVPTTIEDVGAINATAASPAGLNRNVSISVLAADVTGKGSGDYSDVITFSMVTK